MPANGLVISARAALCEGLKPVLASCVVQSFLAPGPTVVYNVDGNAIHISAGVSWSAVNASTNETPNAFSNNIFAFADAGMLTEQQPWAGEGCPSSGNLKWRRSSDSVAESGHLLTSSLSPHNESYVTPCLADSQHRTFLRFEENRIGSDFQRLQGFCAGYSYGDRRQ